MVQSVLLLQNVFSYYKYCPLTVDCVLLDFSVSWDVHLEHVCAYAYVCVAEPLPLPPPPLLPLPPPPPHSLAFACNINISPSVRTPICLYAFTKTKISPRAWRLQQYVTNCFTREQIPKPTSYKKKVPELGTLSNTSRTAHAAHEICGRELRGG